MTASWKWFVAGFATVVSRALIALPTMAATFGATPSTDAFVTTGPGGNLSGNNYGGGGGIALSAPGLPKGEFQSVLQFDLASARNAFENQFGSGQWNVQSAFLQLNATPANNAIFNVPSAGKFQVFWMQNDSWTEGTGGPSAPATTGITFASLQNTFIEPGDESLGTFSFGGATSGAVSYSLNLTPSFAADVAAGNPVSLRLVAADNSVSYLFNSRNFGTAANRPVFTVEAVPEPGSTALLILGTACIAGRRGLFRRRNDRPMRDGKAIRMESTTRLFRE